MPYTTCEYIPGKVLYQELYGEFSTVDLQQAGAELMLYLEHAEKPLHLITDLRRAVSYPINIRDLSKTLQVRSHPRMGWEILISNNPAVHFIGSSVAKLATQASRAARFRAYDTPDEVMVFLKRLDSSLTHLPPLPGDSSQSA